MMCKFSIPTSVHLSIMIMMNNRLSVLDSPFKRQKKRIFIGSPPLPVGTLARVNVRQINYKRSGVCRTEDTGVSGGQCEDQKLKFQLVIWEPGLSEHALIIKLGLVLFHYIPGKGFKFSAADICLNLYTSVLFCLCSGCFV